MYTLVYVLVRIVDTVHTDGIKGRERESRFRVQCATQKMKEEELNPVARKKMEDGKNIFKSISKTLFSNLKLTKTGACLV